MNFLMKAMLRKQMKNIPAEQQDKIISAFEKDPEFFKKIADQIQAKVKAGRDQQAAAMEVMRENQSKLSELMK
ncbi:MAG TPA: hypothetical protein PKA60_02690 [Candidatus Paceibacterota bacterium]|nr:hypothetical protein [Candidatus Paceibacterota bacterium]